MIIPRTPSSLLSFVLHVRGLALRENQRASYIFECTYLSALKYRARYARWFYAV